MISVQLETAISGGRSVEFDCFDLVVSKALEKQLDQVEAFEAPL